MSRLRNIARCSALWYALAGSILLLVVDYGLPELAGGVLRSSVPAGLEPWLYVALGVPLVYLAVRFGVRRRGAVAGGRRETLLASIGRVHDTAGSILDGAPQGILGMDREGRAIFANPALCRMLGFAEEDLLGRVYHGLVHSRHPDGRLYPKKKCPIVNAVRQGAPCRGEEYLLRKDGSGIPVEFACAPLWEGEEALGGVVFLTDISSRKRDEKSLRQAAAVYRSTTEGIIITDPGGVILDVNPAFSTITGYAPEEVIGNNPRILKSGHHDRHFYDALWQTLDDKGHWRGEIRNRYKDGSIHTEWLTISSVRDERGRPVNYVAVFRDITGIKQAHAELEYLAHHDPLTGLPNRTLYNDRLAHAIDRAEREGCRVAVLFLDLDRFKDVNDTLGHAVGDELLCQVAERLKACMREMDTLARLGGDEFIVLLDRLDQPGDAAVVARKLLGVLQPPFKLLDQELYVSSSIGISCYPDHGADPGTLVRNADAAMYRSKEQGRGAYGFYAEKITERARERLRMQAELRHAMAQNQLYVEYQPQFSLAEGEVTGVEALLRWHHPRLGVLWPEQFIPDAEEGELVGAIGEWVLHTVCRDLTALDRAGIGVKRVAVNLSPVQLRDRRIVERIREILEQAGLEPGRLELELKETALMQQPEQYRQKLQRLRALGVRLAIDYFGTGACSLGILSQLPIDRLKIDRSFLKGLPRNTDNAAICGAMTALGHSLGMRIGAEGVENAAQKTFLAGLGCDEAQGSLFGAAVSAADLVELWRD